MGYEGGVVPPENPRTCDECLGDGKIPSAQTVGMDELNDIIGKCNDILNKCNDIMEKLNE